MRYDERGGGMSDWQVGRLSMEQWTDDLESVIAAARPTEPVTLLGISQGAAVCINYAIRLPEQVGRMILSGGYAHGVYRRNPSPAESTCRAMIELTWAAWGLDNPTFRQLLTSWFIPGGSHEQLQCHNDLRLRPTTGESAAKLFGARATADIEFLLGQVRTPTLVLHTGNDEVVPIAEGRLIASTIAGAEFAELDSRSHVLLEQEPAWTRFCEAVGEFLGPAVSPASRAVTALSPREREVLALMADGLSNIEIATRMQISEKTARNHATNLFDKLGVSSRAQAIVFARDRRFTG